MGRPPLPIGTCGKIKVTLLGPKLYEARAEYRDRNGRTKSIRRRARSKTAAENRVKEDVVELVNEVRSGEVSRDHRIEITADLWMAELDRDEEKGDLAHGTVRLYKGCLKNWILPSLAKLHWFELSVGACERVIFGAQDRTGFETASTVKTTLGLFCGYAVRHGALDTNPVKSTKRLSRGDEEQKEVRALEPDERADFFAKVDEFIAAKAIDKKRRSLGPRVQSWGDLRDLSEAFMSTGARIGELLAVIPEDVDLAARTVALDFHVVRITGKGLVRKANRKGNKGGLLLGFPEWSLPMWRRRVLATTPGQPLFANLHGDLLDPSNVGKRLSALFDEIGFEWLTSHALGRKTVAAVLDDAGLTVTETADQLGNTPTVVEKNYRRRRKANPKAVKALEDMFEGRGG